jgi:phospholipase/carboxylesterase
MKSPFHYEIRYPENMDPQKKYPVIFALHGIGSNEKNILGMLEKVKNDFILIGIRGQYPFNKGYTFFHIIKIGFPVREEFDQCIKDLRDFITYATEKYPINPERRFLFGFSMGAILAMTLPVVMGNELKGAVACTGYIPHFVREEYPIQPMDQVDMYISHGAFDEKFPLEVGNSNAAFFENRARSVHYKVFETGHQVIPENEEDYVSWLLAREGIGTEKGES